MLTKKSNTINCNKENSQPPDEPCCIPLPNFSTSSRTPLSANKSEQFHTPYSQRHDIDYNTSKRPGLNFPPGDNLFNRFNAITIQPKDNFFVSHIDNDNTPRDILYV